MRLISSTMAVVLAGLTACNGSFIVTSPETKDRNCASGCTPISTLEENDGTDEVDDPNEFTKKTNIGDSSFALNSSTWLRDGSVGVTINCNGAEAYGFSTSADATEPGKWFGCSDSEIVTVASLVDNENSFRVWFKGDSAGLVTKASDPIRFFSAPFFLIKDPSPDSGTDFGDGKFAFLANGNFVLNQSYDNTDAIQSGAVYLFDATDGAILREIRGDVADDNLGEDGFHAFPNGNVAVRTSRDDVVGGVNHGSVILLNGETGDTIGELTGDQDNNRLGSGSIVELSEHMFALLSPNDDSAALTDNGSVYVLDSASLSEVEKLEGPTSNYGFGAGVTALDSGDYVVHTSSADTGAVTDHGAAILFDGTTHTEIGRVEGNESGDLLGFLGAKKLLNGNYVVTSYFSDNGAIVDAGKIVLVSGSTGTAIATIEGDNPSDSLSLGGFAVLDNGDFVSGGYLDDIDGKTDAGSVILFNGTTGAEIGRIEGDQANNKLGEKGVFKLPNGNYVIASPGDDTATLTDNGSAILVDGSTGLEISRIEGDDSADKLGSSHPNPITVLVNGNYLVTSQYSINGAATNAGSVILVNGVTGTEIGRIEGERANDYVGWFAPVELANGNVVVRANDLNTDTLSDVGAAILMNGKSGAEIARITGTYASDYVSGGGITKLDNGNFVICSPDADTASLPDAGSVHLVNGSTGAIITRIDGDQAGDKLCDDGVIQLRGGKFAFFSWLDDDGAVSNSGSVIIVDSNSGKVLKKVYGPSANAKLGYGFYWAGYAQHPTLDYLIVGASNASIDAISQSGALLLIPF